MIMEVTEHWVMAKGKDQTADHTKVVTWNQLGVLLGVVLALLTLVGILFMRNIDGGFESVKGEIRGNLKSFKAELMGDLTTIRQSIGTIEKQFEKFDGRLTRLEFPAFKEKAEAVGIKPTLAEFKHYQTKAESLGLTVPEYVPVRLDVGFRIISQGVLADGTGYNLIYRVFAVEKNRVRIAFDGNIGNNRFRDNIIEFPLKVGYQVSLNRFAGELVGRTLPEVRIAILAQPTDRTLILASGSPTSS